MIVATAKTKLLHWYRENQRDLPWRSSRDPYRIWISETMLQQTTVQAVIPYFEKFLKRFPTIKSLAKAQIEDVLEQWSGLGYYSRARNLHKAAQSLAKRFPQTSSELLALSGFGPYTARAVASLAFDESCGVLDGNVIRVLSRIHNLALEWWKPSARQIYQTIADEWVRDLPSHEMNQALMELGATICIPQNPVCLLCPLQSSCVARQENTIELRPLKKARRERELWTWQPQIFENRGRVLICRSDATPFLKNQWLLPGTARKVHAVPKKFHFKHTITHHDIFVTVKPSQSKIIKDAEILDQENQMWVRTVELSRYVPASLVLKAMAVHRGK
jgi:A/G-specific adenine glycosylase